MKAMLKSALVALGLAATMAMGLQAASAAEDSLLQKVLNRGTLRVGTTGDYPPYSEIDQANNTYKGYEIDVVTALADISASRSNSCRPAGIPSAPASRPINTTSAPPASP